MTLYDPSSTGGVGSILESRVLVLLNLILIPMEAPLSDQLPGSFFFLSNEAGGF